LLPPHPPPSPPLGRGEGYAAKGEPRQGRGEISNILGWLYNHLNREFSTKKFYKIRVKVSIEIAEISEKIYHKPFFSMGG